MIDGADESVLITLTVGNAPAGVATNLLTKKTYVANYGGGSVTVIDGSTHTVSSTIDLGGTSGPEMVGINMDTNKIYVAYRYNPTDEAEIIDGATDAVSATYSVLGDHPVGVGPNPVTGKVYAVIWGSSTIEIIDANTDANIGSISLIDSYETGGIAVNPVTNRIYVPDFAGTGGLQVINGATDALLTTVTVGDTPSAVAVNVLTNTVYVTNNADNTVSVINGDTNAVVTTVGVGTAPLGIAVNHSDNTVYVVNRTDGTVSVIDGATNTVTNTITVGTNPFYVSVLEYQE